MLEIWVSQVMRKVTNSQKRPHCQVTWPPDSTVVIVQVWSQNLTSWRLLKLINHTCVTCISVIYLAVVLIRCQKKNLEGLITSHADLWNYSTDVDLLGNRWKKRLHRNIRLIKTRKRDNLRKETAPKSAGTAAITVNGLGLKMGFQCQERRNVEKQLFVYHHKYLVCDYSS